MSTRVFGALVASSFQRNDAGEDIFYPYGKLGSGYVVTPEIVQRLTASYKKLHLGSLVGFLVALFVIGFWSIPAVLSVSIGWSYLLTRKYTKGLPKTSRKMSLDKARKKVLDTASFFSLILGWVSSISLILLFAYSLMTKGFSWQTVIMLALFVACFVGISWMLWEKRRHNDT